MKFVDSAAARLEVNRFQSRVCRKLRKKRRTWRGDLLDDKGNRAPGLPVFELDDGEPEQDGLYIRRTSRRLKRLLFFEIVAGARLCIMPPKL